MTKINKKIFVISSIGWKIPFAFKMVYLSNIPVYFGISFIVFLSFWIFFNMADQLLFFSPFFYFYIPSDAIIGFTITNVSAILLGMVIALNIYAFRTTKIKINKSLLSGSILGISSAACASCSSIGFLIISTFGSFGIITTGFFTNYQIPLRLLSIVAILVSMLILVNRITTNCKMNNQQ